MYYIYHSKGETISFMNIDTTKCQKKNFQGGNLINIRCRPREKHFLMFYQ